LLFISFQAAAAAGKEASKGGKGDKNAGNKSPVKGGKAAGGAQKKGQDQTSPKVESKLKKRGDVDPDAKFISKHHQFVSKTFVVTKSCLS
jgi:hypothetical protein